MDVFFASALTVSVVAVVLIVLGVSGFVTRDRVVDKNKRGFADRLAGAGFTTTPVAFAAFCGGVAAIAALVALAIWPQPFVVLIASLSGVVPYAWVQMRFSARQERIASSLGEVVSLLRTGLHGSTIERSVESLAKNAPVEVRSAFETFAVAYASDPAHDFEANLRRYVQVPLANADFDVLVEYLVVLKRGAAPDVTANLMANVEDALRRKARIRQRVHRESRKNATIAAVSVGMALAALFLTGSQLLDSTDPLAYAALGSSVLVEVVAMVVVVALVRMPQPSRIWFNDRDSATGSSREGTR